MVQTCNLSTWGAREEVGNQLGMNDSILSQNKQANKGRGWLRRDSGMSVFVNVRLTLKRGALERGGLELLRDSTVLPILTPTNYSHCFHKQKQSQPKISVSLLQCRDGRKACEDSRRKPSSKTLRRKPRRERPQVESALLASYVDLQPL